MAVLFQNGFEEGNTSAWDTTDGSPIVSGAHNIFGAYGMGCDLSVAGEHSVRKNLDSDQTKIRIRTYCDFVGIDLTPAAGTRLIVLRNEVWGYVATVELWDTNEIVFTGIRKDDASSLGMQPVPIAYTRFIELELAMATGVGANDGYAKFWKNGILQEEITGIDNDLQRIRRIDIGNRDGWGTRSGTVRFDEIVIEDTHYIGRYGYNPLPQFIKQSH